MSSSSTVINKIFTGIGIINSKVGVRELGIPVMLLKQLPSPMMLRHYNGVFVMTVGNNPITGDGGYDQQRLKYL